jgi:hypothetical protein
MPVLLIGLGLLVGVVLTIAAHVNVSRIGTSVGAAPRRPPVAYVGDHVFALPTNLWGRCESIVPCGQGYKYGVRFPSGAVAVLGEHEVVK